MSVAEQDHDATTTTERPVFRGDIDGLRAVAIILVVAFHARLPGVSGGFIGVDVFFVISGFLITRNLLHESSASGSVALLDFWAKRARRLVPALALMVLVTLGASWFVLSPLELPQVAEEGAASALYVSNVLFARESTDYFTPVTAESPFLHTWSLGVEEQFYVVWPLVFVAVGAVVRRRPAAARRLLVAGFAALLVGSLALSVVLTPEKQAWAFFLLPTRAWEFAAAGLLAAAPVPALLHRRTARMVCIAAGALLVAYATIAYTDLTPYPGYRVVVPVVGTVLLILAGSVADERPLAATRVLSCAPAQWLGRVSYSWYLWHWPFMILAVAAVGDDTTLVRTVAGLAALPVAALAYRRFETPVRFSPALTASMGRTFGAAALVTIVVVAVGVGVHRGADRRNAEEPYATMAETIAIHESDECELTPSAGGIEHCSGGDPAGERTVMLIGDSHARQWVDAFDAAASDIGVRFVARYRSACPSYPVDVTNSRGQFDDGCEDFRADTDRLIDEIGPDVVVVANHDGYVDQILGDDRAVADRATQRRRWGAAAEEQLRSLTARVPAVALVVDNPRFPDDPLICSSRPGGSEDECRPTLAEAMARTGAFQAEVLAAMERTGELPTLSTTDQICGSGRCAITQDGIYVYADTNHLSGAWTATQEPAIVDLLRAAGL